MPNTFVLRDDLLPYGTKTRKFSSLIPFLAPHKKIVLIGGENSHNVAALAKLLQERGHEVYGVLRKAYGHSHVRAEIPGRILERHEWNDRHEIAKEYGGFVVPEGAVLPASIEGLKTLGELIQEPYDSIWIDAGTGLSAAVLVCTLAEKNHPAMVHVLPVARTDFQGMLTFVQEYFPKELKLRYTIESLSRYRSFGTKLPKTLLEAYEKKEGMRFHPLYSGKLYFHFSEIEPSNALFIHTGATP